VILKIYKEWLPMPLLKAIVHPFDVAIPLVIELGYKKILIIVEMDYTIILSFFPTLLSTFEVNVKRSVKCINIVAT
jgi:hypothetical protein